MNPDKPQSKLRNAHAPKRVVKRVAKENTLADRGSRAATSATHTLTSKRATESSVSKITPSAMLAQRGYPLFYLNFPKSIVVKYIFISR